MRTLIDLEDKQVKELDRLARSRNRSRASLIREAVADFLGKEATGRRTDAFGLWAGKKVDALVHQDKLRGEW